MGFWDDSGISWTICKQSAPRSRQITTPTPHHSIFYRPDALPDTQPTVSRHCPWTNFCLYDTLKLTNSLTDMFSTCCYIKHCHWQTDIKHCHWQTNTAEHIHFLLFSFSVLTLHYMWVTLARKEREDRWREGRKDSWRYQCHTASCMCVTCQWVTLASHPAGGRSAVGMVILMGMGMAWIRG